MNLPDRLRDALQTPGSADLLTGDICEDQDSAPQPAAVLIALTERSNPGVILTVRREDMRTHAGQVAFPGGRIDAGESATDAAIREAWEEVGLDPLLVQPIAELDPYRTVTDFSVTPVIAVIPPDLQLSPHEREVAEVFEAPLDYLLDPANQHRQAALFRGRERHYYEIVWNGRRIWGATAAMIVNLSHRLQWR